MAVGKSVLLIEDDQNVMDIAVAFLESLGCRVLCARSGKEAVVIAENSPETIDIALLDIKLPDMSGVHVYPQIIHARPHLKVIVTSGYSREGDVQEVLDSGAHGYLQKPFSLEALSAVLNEVVDA